MPQQTTFCELELSHAENTEKSKRFIQNAIEMALSLGDFQKEIDSQCTNQVILEKTAKRIGKLIAFEASALYQVDEENSDIQLSVCTPAAAAKKIENEVDFLIDNGFIAWAIREQRGVTVYSKDGSRQIMLHVLSTYSRIRGLFVGVFSPGMKRLPDAALEILSIILRNAANGIESLTFSRLLLDQKNKLETKVEEKSRELIRFERQLMQAQKMEAIAALAGGVAHQFNNALTGLIGNLDLIELKMGNDPDIARYLERSLTLTGRMTGLTNQLLSYAQGGKYTAGKVSLKNVINDLVHSQRRSIKPSVTLETELPDDHLTATVDVTQMQMAISAMKPLRLTAGF